MSRVMGIVGFKESGKTSLIEKLARELVGRGFTVGVVKHTTRPYSLDTPRKDTWRYSQAGAKTSAILTSKETAIFLHQPEELDTIMKVLGPLDLVLLEGLKELDRVPRIILARDKSEVQRLRNGLEVAVIGEIANGNVQDLEIPVLDVYASRNVADIVVEKSMPLLPGLNCRKCGFSSCRELAKEVLEGKAEVSRCVNMPSKNVQVTLDGTPLKINPFVGKIMKKVVMGVLSTLEGVRTPRNVMVQFQVEKEQRLQ